MGRQQVKNLIGRRFGRLVVAERCGNDKWGRAKWRCQCDCGNEVFVITGSLLSGNTKSCGCLSRERLSNLRSKHKMTGTKEYNLWKRIKQRCYDPNDAAYLRYGGRGITMCERWKNSFENFFADIGKCPGNDYSIDRIDNNGGYEPNNWRWATNAEQSRNRRSNVRLEYDGVCLVKYDWEKSLGVWRGFIDRGFLKGLSFAQIIEEAHVFRLKKAARHWHEDLMESSI